MLKDGETTTTGDALPEEGQSSGGEVSPSAPKAKMYSEEEMKRYEADRHAPLDRTIAQLRKDLKEARETGEATASELKAMQKQLDDAEVARIGDDPEKVSVYQLRRTVQEERSKAAAEKREATRLMAEAKAEKDAMAADKAEIAIGKLAIKYKLPDKTLRDLGINDIEALEKVAVTLAANMATKAKPDGFNLDSGLSSGGVGEPTMDQLEKMSEAEYAKWASQRFKGR